MSDLAIRPLLTRDDLLQAAAAYDEETYPADLYRDNLKILSAAKSVSEDVKGAVSALFHWKLGKATRFRTPTSYSLNYVNPDGRQYYGIKMTAVNKAVLDAAMDTDLMESAIQFRDDDQLPYESMKIAVSSITKTSIVLPTFYLHIWKPARYPIFDENVWKLYRHQSGAEIKAETKPRTWKHFEEYVPWFREIVERTGLDPVIADRGLWVLGGDIKADANRYRRNGRAVPVRKTSNPPVFVEKVVEDYLALSPQDQELFRLRTNLD